MNEMNSFPKIQPHEGDRLLLVSLNRSFAQTKSEGIYQRRDLYESARKYWRLADKKARQVDYILGIYKGIVRIVIKVDGFSKVGVGDHEEVYNPPRYVFEGQVIEYSPYLNKNVSDHPFGSGGAITYIPRDKASW